MPAIAALLLALTATATAGQPTGGKAVAPDHYLCQYMIRQSDGRFMQVSKQLQDPSRTRFVDMPAYATGAVIVTIGDPSWTDVVDGHEQRLSYIFRDARFDDIRTVERRWRDGRQVRVTRTAYFPDERVLDAIKRSTALTVARNDAPIAVIGLDAATTLPDDVVACTRQLYEAMSVSSVARVTPVRKKKRR